MKVREQWGRSIPHGGVLENFSGSLTSFSFGRTLCGLSQIQLLFPEEGLVYDYKLSAGLSSTEDDLDEDVVWEVK